MPEAGGAAALPPFFEFHAAAEWQAVDFLSDLHLSAALPRTFEAWARHLAATTADAVFILGDLFEAWVGDDARSYAFEGRCVDVLADAASRRPVAFMAGNRDFLVGSRLLRETGMTGLPDPTLLEAWGQRLLLTHGDALCIDDAEYQHFRRLVRGNEWQADFLARPLTERTAIVAQLRQASQQRRLDTNTDADVDPATAVQWMHALGAHEMVHGHTHRPGSNLLAPGYKRHVLGDWDLDDAAHPRAEVLRLTRDGFERIAPAT